MKLEGEQDLTEWAWSAESLAVVSAWNALGLFDRLRKGPMRRAEIPADARAVTNTLPVLAHLGLVATDGERVALTPIAERLMDARALPTERNLDMLRDLGRMVDVLRDGGPVHDDKGQSKGTRGGTVDDPVRTERFLDMLYRISEGAARGTFEWLAPDLPKRGAVLDLGGGHGRYARAFADAGHDVTLFDQPPVVQIARKRHGDALKYSEGDFHEVESFGGPYDLILLCNIVHGESDAANASIVKRAAKSLNAGGRIAIRDMFLDERGRDPASAVYFGITMLLYTDHGTSPTARGTEGWMKAAGLGEVKTIVLDSHQIVVGRRA